MAAQGIPPTEIGLAPVDKRISVAPMMDYTDRHYRYLMRLVSKRTWAYTEMVTSNALLHGDPHRHLQYNEAEHPIVLQLGGSEPDKLYDAVKLSNTYGYDEYNLNVGCPSDRVQKGRFGACLMLEPQLVAECVTAMSEATHKPVTVKHRIGVDEKTGFDFTAAFLERLEKTACRHIMVHARSAWLKGLSPKENRSIPPLDYEVVYRLKKAFGDFFVEINGGIQTVDAVCNHLQQVDGVMIGRAAVGDLYLLSRIDSVLYGEKPVDRFNVTETYIDYIKQQLAVGCSLAVLTKPLLGLYAGQKGGRAFRRTISEAVAKKAKALDFIYDALSHTQKV